jgi:hypothetical protein
MRLEGFPAGLKLPFPLHFRRAAPAGCANARRLLALLAQSPRPYS